MAGFLTPETQQTILVIILFYCLNILKHLEYITDEEPLVPVLRKLQVAFFLLVCRDRVCILIHAMPIN